MRAWNGFRRSTKPKANKVFFRSYESSSPEVSDPLPAYDQLAVKMGLPASTLRSHVARMRMRYRELLRAEVRQTVETEAEVDEELHELFRVLAGG